MRVMIADQNAHIRWALGTAIREQPGLLLVGESSEAVDLLLKVRALRPEVVIVEWELPGRSGESLLSALGGEEIAAKVIVLSAGSGVRMMALSAGADAFLTKDADPAHLISVLQDLALGNLIDDGSELTQHAHT